MDVPMDCSSIASSETTVAGGGAPDHRYHNHQQQSPAQHVAQLLATARQLVGEGRPSLALQAVVMAVKAKGGDEAVLHTLNRARMLYQSKLAATSAADELARLFAECAIVEAHPEETVMSEASSLAPPPSNVDVDNKSILAESGRNQIVLDFYMDGSSFICLQCGGLVGNQRRDEHLAYWCCGRP